MALIKEIILNNGIPTTYHRVVSVTCMTNVHNIIEVASYTSSSKREEEKSALPTGGKHNVFIDTTLHNTDYDQNMTVTSAYEYLKTIPEFAGAEDDLDASTTEEVMETESTTDTEEVENNETIEQNV